MEGTESVMLPALDSPDGHGVVWRSVEKLVNYINESQRIDKDLQYSFKARLKSSDPEKILNTLTVYYSIGLNGVVSVRRQVGDKKHLQLFGKVYSRSKDLIIQNAVMQLLMDWSFLYGQEEIGRRSDRLLRELNSRGGKSVRPTSFIAQIYEEIHSENPPTTFLKGFQFEHRSDQILTEEGEVKEVDLRGLKSCTPAFHHGSFKFGSMKKMFTRPSLKSLNSSKKSSIVQELSTRGEPQEPPPHPSSQLPTRQIDELLVIVPRDCKKLQDLLSDVQVLLNRGQTTDIDSKMQVAESLRNKCALWKQKVQDMVALKIKKEGINEIEESSTSTSSISSSSLTKLLAIGETLHMVLAEFEQIHKTHITQLEIPRRDEDRLSFASARSSSSATSINFQSTGDFQWVDFNSERDGGRTADVDSSGIARSTSLENGNSKFSPKYTTNQSAKLRRITQSNSPSSIHKLKAIPVPLESTSAIPKPPISVFSMNGGTSRPNSSTKQVMMGKSELPKSQSSRVERTNNIIEKVDCYQRPSRSFSELKTLTPHRQSLNLKRLPNCPALKVRFTDDHLAEVLDQMERLR